MAALLGTAVGHLPCLLSTKVFQRASTSVSVESVQEPYIYIYIYIYIYTLGCLSHSGLDFQVKQNFHSSPLRSYTYSYFMRPIICICCNVDMRVSGNQAFYFIVHKNSCLLNEKGKASVLCHFKICFMYACSCLLYTCLHSERSFVFCVKESRAKCNAEKLLLLTYDCGPKL